jgi:hypothetical protein
VTRAFAQGLDVPAMQFDETANYGQTDTEATLRARKRAVRLLKEIEHARESRLPPYGLGAAPFIR